MIIKVDECFQHHSECPMTDCCAFPLDRAPYNGETLEVALSARNLESGLLTTLAKQFCTQGIVTVCYLS